MIYDLIILDCDGVILDSNSLKSEMLGKTVESYGSSLTDQFIEYHKQHGGISRYEKFDYFLRSLVGRFSESQYQELISRFSNLAKEALIRAPMTPGARDFLDHYSVNTPIFLVSGGDQEELREIFKERDLANFFCGIFGSPESKVNHCSNITMKFDHTVRGIFIGDSRLDYLAAQTSNFDFIFMSDFTELQDWETFCFDERLRITPNLGSLIGNL
jgi:phosphoglycolate phosphatase-like HAD superfamily hydrolase